MSFLDALSPRARTYLQTVGFHGDGPRLSDDDLRARFTDLPPDHLEYLLEFERRYGGAVIDDEERELQLGIGALEAIEIAPQVTATPVPLVRVGDETYGEIHLAADGMLWWMGPDRELAPLATSVEKYIERLAVESEFHPWPEPAFRLECEPRIAELAAKLGLERDDIASDDTFEFYCGPRHYAWARLRGTNYQTSRAELFCRGFDDLVAALQQLVGWRCSMLMLQPGVREEKLEAVEAPTVAALEDRLAKEVRFEGVEPGTAIFLCQGRVEAYETLDDGGLKAWQTLDASGGVYRWYLIRWQ